MKYLMTLFLLVPACGWNDLSDDHRIYYNCCCVDCDNNCKCPSDNQDIPPTPPDCPDCPDCPPSSPPEPPITPDSPDETPDCPDCPPTPDSPTPPAPPAPSGPPCDNRNWPNCDIRLPSRVTGPIINMSDTRVDQRIDTRINSACPPGTTNCNINNNVSSNNNAVVVNR